MHNRLNICDLADLCDKVTWTSDRSFNSRCLVHDDNKPSMTAPEPEDGNLLIYCHAGCSQAELLAAAGMTSNKSVYTVRSAREHPKPQTATFSYAKKIWTATKPDKLISWDQAVLEHPYPMKKGIEHACGAARFLVTGSQIGEEADCIILPMRTLEGEFTGIEAINSEGVKQTFGSKGVLVLGNDRDSSLPQLVVEGWATGVAVLDICHWNACVYVAFGKGRLGAVASRVQTKYCDRTIVIVEEHDG